MKFLSNNFFNVLQQKGPSLIDCLDAYEQKNAIAEVLVDVRSLPFYGSKWNLSDKILLLFKVFYITTGRVNERNVWVIPQAQILMLWFDQV